MIDCSKCNAPCCRNVVDDLSRGDGVCRFLDEETNRCSIYDRRPLICNTDKMFEAFYSQFMSRDEFDEMNRRACRGLLLHGQREDLK